MRLSRRPSSPVSIARSHPCRPSGRSRGPGRHRRRPAGPRSPGRAARREPRSRGSGRGRASRPRGRPASPLRRSPGSGSCIEARWSIAMTSIRPLAASEICWYARSCAVVRVIALSCLPSGRGLARFGPDHASRPPLAGEEEPWRSRREEVGGSADEGWRCRARACPGGRGPGQGTMRTLCAVLSDRSVSSAAP